MVLKESVNVATEPFKKTQMTVNWGSRNITVSFRNQQKPKLMYHEYKDFQDLMFVPSVYICLLSRTSSLEVFNKRSPPHQNQVSNDAAAFHY